LKGKEVEDVASPKLRLRDCMLVRDTAAQIFLLACGRCMKSWKRDLLRRFVVEAEVVVVSML